MPDIFNKIKIKNYYINYILKNKKRNGPNISVVFLCGYKSDINGTKATYLSGLQKKYGFEYLSFDYSGHGKSSGNINNCYFEDWFNESLFIIKKKTSYPIIIIGSSMGGWLAILVAIHLNKKVKAIIGLATAADFTTEMIRHLNIKNKITYLFKGIITYQSSYDHKPYFFSKAFIKNSKKFLLLNTKIKLNCKVALFYGELDNVVTLESQMKILNLLTSRQATLFISKNSNHRMSSKNDLANLEKQLIAFIST